MLGIDLVFAVSDIIGWLTIPWPKPDLDGGTRTLHSVPAASVLIKGRTIRVLKGILNSTSRIIVGASTAIRAIGYPGLLANSGYSAPNCGVNGNFVRAYIVRALEDVDFARAWPVIQTGLPDRRPCSAALWHVPYVEAGDVASAGSIRWGSDLR